MLLARAAPTSEAQNMLRAVLLAALTAMPAPVPGSEPPAAVSPPADEVVATAAAVRQAAQARSGWTWPLEPEPAVVRPFRAPPTPWSAGHRGVDLTAASGEAVHAAANGRVTFSGMVAGRGVVVVTHGTLRTTYEPVSGTRLIGSSVRAGQQIGVVAASGHCAPAPCLHWGLRRGEAYLDPLSMVGAGPPVLKPLR